MTSTIGVKKIQYPNGTDILTLDSSGSLAIADSASVGGTLSVTGATTITGDLTVDTNTLMVDASSNKIGMGVDPSTMPSFATHSIKTANGGGISITSDNAGDNRYIFSYFVI